MDHLAEYGRERHQPLPEAFIWKILKQALEALVQITLQRVEHLDVHTGNLFLHFDTYVNRQHPDIVLGDFGICRILTEAQEPPYAEALAELASFLLDNIMQPIDRRERPVNAPQYSHSVHHWLRTISDGRVKFTLQSLMQDLYPLIPNLMQRVGPSQLPDWMIGYFQNLQNLDF